MNSQRTRTILALATAVAVIASCSQTTPSQSKPFVRIVSIAPDSASLRAGESVQLEVSVEYRSTVDGGNLALIVYDDADVVIAEQAIDVAEGQRTTTLATKLVVPGVRQLRVAAAFWGDGGNSDRKADAFATHEYVVVSP